ncbi:MAG: hypothetical protein NVSMB29_03890 [Candidatus Dormibacteria bacterium]
MTSSGRGCWRRRSPRARGQSTIEFALVAPLFFLSLLGCIDAALWSLQTSDAVASSEAGIRIAVSSYGAPGAPGAATPNSRQVEAAIAPRMRQALFGTDVQPWPAAAGPSCPTSSAAVERVLGPRVMAVCVENRGGFVHLVVVGNVASLVPPVFGLWHAGEIPMKVGAVSHTLTFE